LGAVPQGAQGLYGAGGHQRLLGGVTIDRRKGML